MKTEWKKIIICYEEKILVIDNTTGRIITYNTMVRVLKYNAMG
jgi:hypothetical protein